MIEFRIHPATRYVDVVRYFEAHWSDYTPVTVDYLTMAVALWSISTSNNNRTGTEAYYLIHGRRPYPDR